jgi:hypothetical protein
MAWKPEAPQTWAAVPCRAVTWKPEAPQTWAAVLAAARATWEPRLSRPQAYGSLSTVLGEVRRHRTLSFHQYFMFMDYA